MQRVREGNAEMLAFLDRLHALHGDLALLSWQPEAPLRAVTFVDPQSTQTEAAVAAAKRTSGVGSMPPSQQQQQQQAAAVPSPPAGR